MPCFPSANHLEARQAYKQTHTRNGEGAAVCVCVGSPLAYASRHDPSFWTPLFPTEANAAAQWHRVWGQLSNRETCLSLVRPSCVYVVNVVLHLAWKLNTRVPIKSERFIKILKPSFALTEHHYFTNPALIPPAAEFKGCHGYRQLSRSAACFALEPLRLDASRVGRIW